MREPPQNHSSRHYERPNQPWICGLASDGDTCPVGPTAHGQCPALGECLPVRDGDRWQCGRSALRGGVCGEGPTPEGGCGRVHRCQPVRSLRAIRGRFVRACTLLAAGALLILLSANWRDRAISPGPLSNQHAQVLGTSSSGQSLQENRGCAACHAAAEHGAAEWTASLVLGNRDRFDQSQRCILCHERSIPQQHALAAHSLPASELQLLSANRHASTADQQLACASCHREHHGAQFDLTAMSDAACQSCHQRVYQGFSTDHPEFGSWPYKRRTRIVFNHASHQVKHFAEKKQPFDCRACHFEHESRGAQLTAGFEAACASCHEEKIATSVAQGIPLFALPTLDIEALQGAGHDVGTWPDGATGDFDGKLPPVMKLLLAADSAAAAAMATLGEDFDFYDIDPDDPKQLQACAALATAIQKLMAELSASSSNAVRDRLRSEVRVEADNSQLTQMLAALPAEMVGSAAKEWFAEPGGLSPAPGAVDGTAGAGIASRSAKQKVMPLNNRRRVAFDPAGAWHRDDTTFAIRYTPGAHADPVLAAWLELLAATPDFENRPVARAMFDELTKPTAAGLCTLCHSVEAVHDGQLTVHWHSHDQSAEPRGFTRFPHGPHLLLPSLADCTSCHIIDATKSESTPYAGVDPHSFVSDFRPMTRQQCAQCHTAKMAGDSCQKCHNYHVERMEEWRLD